MEARRREDGGCDREGIDGLTLYAAGEARRVVELMSLLLRNLCL